MYVMLFELVIKIDRVKQTAYADIKDYCITGRANVISCAVGFR